MNRSVVTFWAGVSITAIALRATAVGETALALPLALIPVLIVLFERKARDWAVAGGAIGLVYVAAILVALAKWGLAVMFGLWLAIALAFAVFFGGVGAVASRASDHLRPWAIAGAWCASIAAIDYLAYTPVYLSAPIAPHSAIARASFALVGAPAVEGLIVLAAASIAGVVVTRKKSIILGLLPSFAVLMLALDYTPPARAGEAVLHTVQPSFSSTDYLARGWSLEARHHLTSTIEELTEGAVRREPGTILWPENGTGLADAQLASRRARLQAVLGETHDLVVTGLGYEDGRRYVTAVHLDRRGVRNVATKAKLVPLAESQISAGAARVFQAIAGRVGIAVCFDVLFRDHLARLVEEGADVLAVTSDNASFGVSLISSWHEGYAVMRAAEVERSVLFGINRGPAITFDATTNTVERVTPAGARTVGTVHLGRTNASGRSTFHLAAVITFALIALMTTTASTRAKTPSLSTRAFAPIAACAVMGIVLELGQVALFREMTPRTVMSDVAARRGAHLGIDAIAPQFRQSHPKSCGLAALAYVMTTLGDQVFEESLRGVELGLEGSNLAQLEAAARRRGFDTSAVRAEHLDDLPLGGGRAALLHLERGHFVALTGTTFEPFIFDPATGRTAHLHGELDGWSGHALLLSLPSLSSLVVNDAPALTSVELNR
jgi:apolipoprotein N-acyltransferase